MRLVSANPSKLPIILSVIFWLQIDDDVIKACKKHLRGVCHDVLDQYDGVHHRIVLEDCVKVLKDFASRGKKVIREWLLLPRNFGGLVPLVGLKTRLKI